MRVRCLDRGDEIHHALEPSWSDTETSDGSNAGPVTLDESNNDTSLNVETQKLFRVVCLGTFMTILRLKEKKKICLLEHNSNLLLLSEDDFLLS